MRMVNDSHFGTIISVHLPKTAGTTFLYLLRQALGFDAVIADYTDDPCDPNSPRNLDPAGYFANPASLTASCRAVHGHFHIHKYASVHNPFRITFLRHPVDTILSIYSYWKTLAPGRHPLHDYFLTHHLDVFETARLPLLRHILTHNYFQGVDMKSFHYIGSFESFATDLPKLSKILGITLAADVHLNKIQKSSCPDVGMFLEAHERTRLRDILIEDVRFYEMVTGVG